MLFAAVALTGVLASVGMQTLTGPVTTITRVTQKNIADTQMLMSGRIIINAAVAGTAGGDADTDGIIEPASFVAAGGGETPPTGGGWLPTSLGLSLTDPWGTRYGYCVWDHGTTNSSSGRLIGDNTAGATTQPVIAVIAAGPDKTFQTTCAAYSSGPVAVTKAGGSDDLILKYTYAEATASSNGLWTLNPTDQAKAQLKDSGGTANVTIDRSTGIGDFLGILTSSIVAKIGEVIDIEGALKFDTAGTTADTCGASTKGAARLNASETALELCDGAGTWVPAAAPRTATYITQTPNADLSAEQALSALATGPLKVTAVTGVVSSGAIDLSGTEATGLLAAGRFPALTGDVTTSAGSLATSLAAGVVSNTKLAQMPAATIKGNNTGATANPLDLTATQVTAMLDVFGASGASHTKGLVPTPGSTAGTSRYLREDGTWGVPAGTSAAVTDGDKGDITVSGGGGAWAIDPDVITTTEISDDAVSFAKLQNIAAGKLLGRSSAGAGDTEEIAVGSGLSLSGGTLVATVQTAAADSLDFTEFKDAMALDASTDIAADGVKVLSITNTGAAESLIVRDEASDTTPFVIDATGKVGIATTIPAQALSVNGNIAVGNAGNWIGYDQDSNIAYTGGAFQIQYPTTGPLTFVASSGATDSERLRITSAGNVGIGTNDPKSLLHVAGGVQLGDDSAACPGALSIKLGTMRFNGGALQICAAGGWLAVNAGASVADGDKGDITVSGSGATWTIDNDVVTYAKMQNVTSARLLGRAAAGAGDAEEITLGTGLSFTAGALSVGGLAASQIAADSLDFSEFKDAMTLDASTDIVVTGTNVLSVTNSGTGNSLVVNDASSDTTPFVIDASGNVGIGTTAPRTLLNLSAGVDGAGAVDGPILTLENVDTTLAQNQILGQLAFYSNDASANAAGNMMAIKGVVEDSAGRWGGLGFFTKVGTTESEHMRLDANGNVGIGTTSPDRLLHPELDDATTSAASQVFRLTHTTSGTPATGIGAGMEFEAETAPNNNEVGATIEAVTTDVTATSEDFDLVFKTMAGGTAAAERLRITSTGKVYVSEVCDEAGINCKDISGGWGTSLSDGDKGDVTVSASGATWTIDNGAVSYAKIQNVSATGKLLGRATAGAGTIEEIACDATCRALLDDTTAAAQRTTLGLAIGTDVQAYDATLASIAAYNTDGILVQTAADTFAGRTITGTTDEITVTNGSGVGGNPTLSLASVVNLATKTLRLPSGTTLPATCSVGDVFMDTDATTGQRFYLCQAANSWALQGDGLGGGVGLTDGDKGDITVSGSGSNWQLDTGVVDSAELASSSVIASKVAADVLDFTEFKDAMALDSSTDIATGANTLSITNDGAGDALRINDNGSGDATPFVVDASGNVGIGTSSPQSMLHVAGTIKIGSGGEACDASRLGAIQYVTSPSAKFQMCIAVGSWTDVPTSGGSTAAGADTQVQFNDGGTALGGDADYVWDKTNNRLTLSKGTATPAYDLNFGGEAARQVGLLRRTTAASAGNDLIINAGGAASGGTNLAGGTLNLASGTSTGNGRSKISFQVAGTTAAGALNTTGTTDGAPVERMALMGDGDFIVNGGASGFTGTASVPVTGGGTRMFFDIQKAAFRAGYISGAEWDNASIGNYSTALGEGTTSSGFASMATGRYSLASGQASVAMGYGSYATGAYGIALGYSPISSGNYSTAMGTYTSASGTYSTAIGYKVTAGNGTAGSGQGDGSMAIGLVDDAVTITTASQVTGIQSLGVFMGDQDGLVVSANNQMSLLGGKLVIDPAVPATNLTADTSFETSGTIKIGSGGEACDASREGAIQYLAASDTFQVCATAGSWINIATGSPSIAADSLDFSEFKDAMALDASTDIAASGTNVLSITNTGTANSFVINDQTADTTPFVIDASGNVGIGTASPDYALKVIRSTGTTNDTAYFADTTASTGKTRVLIKDGAAQSGFCTLEVQNNADANYSLCFYPNGGNRILRLGNTGTTGALQVASGATVSGNVGPGVLTVTGGSAADLGLQSGGKLVFASGGTTERMQIDSTGNVGIGTTDPKERLQLGSTLTFQPSSVDAAVRYNMYWDGAVYRHLTANKASQVFMDSTNGIDFQTTNTAGTAGGTVSGLNSRMLITNAGNVGIGTTSPSHAKLDVRDTNTIVQVRSSIPAIVTGSNNGGAIYFGVDNANSANVPTAAIETSWGGVTTPQLGIGVIRDSLRANAIFDYNGNTNIRNGSASIVYIKGDGNVGIGTTNPLSVLWAKGSLTTGGLREVATLEAGGAAAGDGPMLSFAGYNGTVSGGAYPTWRIAQIGAPYTTAGGTWGGGLVFRTNDSSSATALQERMRITHDGNVGIGETAPSSTLHVKGATVAGTVNASNSVAAFNFNDDGSGNTDQLKLYAKRWSTSTSNDWTGVNRYLEWNLSGSQYFYWALKNTTASTWAPLMTFGYNGTDAMAINSSGNVGIGTTGPSYPLDVVGDIRTSQCLRYNSSTLGTCTSDKRLKRAIHPFRSSLDDVLALQPVVYRYNGLGGQPDDNEDKIGFIAQDVAESVPWIVGRQSVKLHADDKDPTDILTVNYGAIDYMMLNAIKELAHKNAELRKENSRELETLRQELESLRSQVRDLQQATQRDPRLNP